MGWISVAGQQLRELLSLPKPIALELPPVAEFDSAPRPVDRVIAEMKAGTPGRVSREQALSVAAVQRGRNSLCSIATLPLVQYKGLDIVHSSFLAQIDPDVANVVTLSQTIEDLAFDGISWWLITAQDFAGYPLAARHLDVRTVSLTAPTGAVNPVPSGVDPRGVKVVWVDGEPTPVDKLIRFDSPNPGLLTANARAIRRALLLDKLASTYADNPRPTDYFTDTDDPSVDPMEDEEIDAFLAEWRAARKAGGTGWIPGNVKRVDVATPSPVEIQLVQLQQQATLEIANGLGVDPEDLGISTTSRTYFNAQDRRTSKINETYSPFMQAITQRLSMGDVTRRGHVVRFDLSDYLKPDPAGLIAYWKGLKEMGVVDEKWIGEQAGISADVVTRAAARPAPAPVDPGGDQSDAQTGAEADRPAAVTFADEQGPAMTFDVADFGAVEPATVDVERRTITGLAVPYNKIASKYGMRFRFLPGSLEYDANNLSRIKHLKDHYTPVGVHTSVDETRRGPIVKLKVLDGPEGSPAKIERDQLLYDAQHGLYDGLSIGVDFSMDPESGDVEWNEKDKVYDVKRATWRETSSTPMPAFDDARVTKVAASRTEGNAMKCTHCGQVHAEGVACPTAPPANQPENQPAGVALNQDQLTALLARPGAIQALVAAQQPQQPERPATPAGALTLSAEQVDGLIRAGQLGALLGVPQAIPAQRQEPEERRQTVDPTRRTVAASVREELPYRFDRAGNLTRGTHDFSSDLIAGSRGDVEALERAQAFVRSQFDGAMAARPQLGQAQFDVDKADAAALNPARQRPDMFVDQLDQATPLWDFVNRGTINDATPFVVPKFSSSTNMVSDHTEGVEPTPGTYVATSQTITPTPLSGKVEVTREAWEQGGSPQLSGLIWRQMQREWYEELEGATGTFLATLTAATDISLGTDLADDALDAAWGAANADLQFIRGGHRFRAFAVHQNLYRAFTGAVDSTGRRLYPIIGPQNATGTAAPRWGSIDLGGVTGVPSWALGAAGTGAKNSWLFNPDDVHGWASAPQRLQFEYRVAYVDVGIWGYKAFANTRIDGVRQVIYTTS
ncbi:phage portal protein [Micromonospora sp. C41]|uniref:phage portal protein n=1 Tax=Micromonospora sp. C41 TaxID=2824878 RepID=UPI001B37F6D6|nr:phage portal protein [Micromonospora sp. C41]MBQ1061324.1 phage portal protein [Micromonospora sp. C41]